MGVAMRLLGLVTAGALSLLTGCAGASYAVQNYKGISPNSFQDPSTGRTFRVFDKPTENRMMITASFADAAKQGALKGITLGGADSRTPEIVYQNAAINYLKSVGRTCSATNTFVVMEPQYEVQYSCQETESG